jgi:plasmid stabilization system protein ParE
MAISKPYLVHPEVWTEIEAADDWYLQRSLDASAAFIATVSEAFDTICQAPLRWPKYLHGTRRFLVSRFPFSIVYLDDPNVVSVVAVAHNKRKPGYWNRRL